MSPGNDASMSWYPNCTTCLQQSRCLQQSSNVENAAWGLGKIWGCVCVGVYPFRVKGAGRSVIVGLLCILCGACNRAAESIPAVRAEPAHLQVLLFDSFSPNADAVLRDKISEWGSQNNVQIEFTSSLPQGGLPQAAQEQGSEQVAEGSLFPGCGTVGDLNYWVVSDALAETTEVIAELGEAGGGYLPNALVPSKLQGKQWAVPIALVNSVLFVRQDKLEDVGLPLPQTWEDVRLAAEAMTVPDAFWGWGMQIGASGDTETAFRTKLWSYGGSVWDNEGRPALDSPATRQVLEFVQEVWLSGVVPPDAPSWDDGGNNEAYLTGRVGMVLNAGSLLNLLQNNDPELLAKTAVLPPPAGPAGRFSPGNVTHWAIFKQAASVDLCMRLTRWLFAPEQIQAYYAAGNGNYLPVYAELLNDPIWQEPNRRVLAEQAPNTADAGYPGPVTPWALEARNNAIIGTMLNRVLIEGWSHDDAIAEADDALWALYESWQEQVR